MISHENPPDIPIDQIALIEVREIIAAMAVLARLDRVFLDPQAGPVLVRYLLRVGHADEDHYLPSIRDWPAAPEVVDVDSGRTYVRALHDRLRHLKPGFDPRPE